MSRHRFATDKGRTRFKSINDFLKAIRNEKHWYDKAKFFDEELKATGEINIGDVIIDLKKLEALLKMDNVKLKENVI